MIPLEEEATSGKIYNHTCKCNGIVQVIETVKIAVDLIQRWAKTTFVPSSSVVATVKDFNFGRSHVMHRFGNR